VLFIGTQFSILYTSMYSPAGAASLTMNTTANRISKRLCLFGKVSSFHFPKTVHPQVKINDDAMIPK
jgi:hypothetical protein